MKVKNIEWLLRIGVAGVFLGHGVLALKQNLAWVPFLTFWGISQDTALDLMIVIGCVDMVVVLSALFRPNKYVLYYAAIWAFLTALMRPLTGATIWAFVERAGNWIAPLCLAILIRKDDLNS